MGRAVSDGQARNLIASFAVDTPWDKISVDPQSFIELPPEQRGRMWAAFLQNNFQLFLGEPRIIQTRPFKPVKFIGKGWEIWIGPANGKGLTGEEYFDPRSRALTQIDITRLRFETCLREGESAIKGEEKILRLKEMADFIRLGGSAFLGFWEDYQANKENSALEWIYRTHKIRFIDFPDDILRNPDGDRSVLYLDRDDDGKWYWNVDWLGFDWNAGSPSAGLASQS